MVASLHTECSRYAACATPSFDRLVEEHIHATAAAVEAIFRGTRDLRALVLGGGYGRGEGGVTVRDGRELPFNDYDWFVVVNGMSRRRRAAYSCRLREAGERLSARFGVDVDFSFPKTIRELRRMPFTLMWTELRLGHMVALGDTDVMSAYPHSDIGRLPLEEVLRLLTNRGMGLLLARDRLAGSPGAPADRDFVARNIHKAALAAGDALLVMHGAYDHSYRRRAEAFSCLGARPDVAAFGMGEVYAEAVRYKLRPDEPSWRSLGERCDTVVSRYPAILYQITERLLRRPVRDYRGYVDALRSSVGDGALPRRLALTARDCGVAAVFDAWGRHHPRRRIQMAMPSILFGDTTVPEAEVAAALRVARTAPLTAIRMRFDALWQRLN